VHLGTQGPPYSLNTFLKDALDLLNPDCAQFATVCKYHAHEIGNLCIFGTSCRFLHLRSLDRPRKNAHHPSTETLKKVQDEVRELREEVSALHSFMNMLVCPSDADRTASRSSAVTPTTTAIKTKTLVTPKEIEPSEHKSASAAPKKSAPSRCSKPKPARPKASSKPSSRSAFASQLSSAFATKTAKSSKAKAKKAASGNGNALSLERLREVMAQASNEVPRPSAKKYDVLPNGELAEVVD
jgi:hypothetical protein